MAPSKASLCTTTHYSPRSKRKNNPNKYNTMILSFITIQLWLSSNSCMNDQVSTTSGNQVHICNLISQCFAKERVRKQCSNGYSHWVGLGWLLCCHKDILQKFCVRRCEIKVERKKTTRSCAQRGNHLLRVSKLCWSIQLGGKKKNEQCVQLASLVMDFWRMEGGFWGGLI